MIDLAFTIGNLNEEHGGAQQLLYDICRQLPEGEFETTVYYLFGEGTFRDSFEAHGTEVVDVGADGNFDVGAFRRLVRHLREAPHDIVHTNSPISGVWGRPAATIAGVDHVVSVEHNVHSSYDRVARTANGVTLPFADAVVGVSQTVSESLLRWERALMPADTRRTTIRNGVDVDAIRATFDRTESVVERHTPFRPSDTIVGTVGRLCEQKGFDHLLGAFPELKREWPDAKLLVLGGGPRAEQLRALAARTDYTDDICLTGYVPEVYPFLPAFDVAVFPSLWEGFGLTPVEAMVAERPIVASDIDTFREVIGDAGRLVPPGDPAAIASEVSSLLDDPDCRAKLGQRGFERVQANYTIERTANEYAALYRSLTDE